MILCSLISFKNDQSQPVLFRAEEVINQERRLEDHQKIDLQLATLNEHFCLSRGYNFRFMGQANVNETLKQKRKKGQFFQLRETINIHVLKSKHSLRFHDKRKLKIIVIAKDMGVNFTNTFAHKAQVLWCMALDTKDTVQFHQQNFTQLYQCTELYNIIIRIMYTMYL